MSRDKDRTQRTDFGFIDTLRVSDEFDVEEDLRFEIIEGRKAWLEPGAVYALIAHLQAALARLEKGGEG